MDNVHATVHCSSSVCIDELNVFIFEIGVFLLFNRSASLTLEMGLLFHVLFIPDSREWNIT